MSVSSSTLDYVTQEVTEYIGTTPTVVTQILRDCFANGNGSQDKNIQADRVYCGDETAMKETVYYHDDEDALKAFICSTIAEFVVGGKDRSGLERCLYEALHLDEPLQDEVDVEDEGEFGAFEGLWIESRGKKVVISRFGVVRYLDIELLKLRYDAQLMDVDDFIIPIVSGDESIDYNTRELAAIRKCEEKKKQFQQTGLYVPLVSKEGTSHAFAALSQNGRTLHWNNSLIWTRLPHVTLAQIQVLDQELISQMQSESVFNPYGHEHEKIRNVITQCL